MWGCRQNSVESRPIPQRQHWFQEVDIRDTQAGLCTEGVFNFFGHFVRANDLHFQKKRSAEEVIELMLVESVIPVFEYDENHPTSLGIHHFKRCVRQQDPVHAIIDVARTKLKVNADSLWNVSEQKSSFSKAEPTEDDWERIRGEASKIRASYTGKSIPIKRRTARSFLGKIEPKDTVIAVASIGDSIPLSTLLRLQGRIVDFIGSSGRKDEMEEMNGFYAVDELTEKEFQYLAQLPFHLTTDTLERNFFNKMDIPFSEEEKRKVKEELHAESKKALDDYYDCRIDQGDYKIHRENHHDGVILEQLADLNPDWKFILVKDSIASGSFGDDSIPRRCLAPGDKNFSDTSVRHQRSVLREMTDWLKERGVQFVVKANLSWPERLVQHIDDVSRVARHSLSLSERPMLELNVNENGAHLGVAVRKHIELNLVDGEIFKAYQEAGITLFQGVQNAVKYYPSGVTAKSVSWEKDRSYANAELIRRAFEVYFEAEGQSKKILVGNAKFSAAKQNALLGRDDLNAESTLEGVIQASHWGFAVNWGVVDITIGQGVKSEEFDNVVINGNKARYQPFFRSLYLWDQVDYIDRRFREDFVGPTWVGAHFGFVQNSTSFSLAAALGWFLAKHESSEKSWVDNIYVRPVSGE